MSEPVFSGVPREHCLIIVRGILGKKCKGLVGPAKAEQLVTRQAKRPNRHAQLVSQSSGVFNQGVESSGVGQPLGVDDAKAIDNIFMGKK